MQFPLDKISYIYSGFFFNLSDFKSYLLCSYLSHWNIFCFLKTYNAYLFCNSRFETTVEPHYIESRWYEYVKTFCLYKKKDFRGWNNKIYFFFSLHIMYPLPSARLRCSINSSVTLLFLLSTLLCPQICGKIWRHISCFRNTRPTRTAPLYPSAWLSCHSHSCPAHLWRMTWWCCTWYQQTI